MSVSSTTGELAGDPDGLADRFGLADHVVLGSSFCVPPSALANVISTLTVLVFPAHSG
jgi:hypothetical protein